MYHKNIHKTRRQAGGFPHNTFIPWLYIIISISIYLCLGGPPLQPEAPAPKPPVDGFARGARKAVPSIWGQAMNVRIPSGNLTQLWNITIFHGKTHYKWPFSIALWPWPSWRPGLVESQKRFQRLLRRLPAEAMPHAHGVNAVLG